MFLHENGLLQEVGPVYPIPPHWPHWLTVPVVGGGGAAVVVTLGVVLVVLVVGGVTAGGGVVITAAAVVVVGEAGASVTTGGGGTKVVGHDGTYGDLVVAPSEPTLVTTRSAPTQVDQRPTVNTPFLPPMSAGLATDGAAPAQLQKSVH